MGNHDPQQYNGIISLLRFFVDTERYGIIDRIGNATAYESIKEAVYEALRIIRSLKASAITVEYEVGGEKRKVACCEYEEKERARYASAVTGKSVTPGRYENKEVACIPCPKIPDENEVADFLTKVKEDTNIAKEVAVLALTYRPKKEVLSG